MLNVYQMIQKNLIFQFSVATRVASCILKENKISFIFYQEFADSNWLFDSNFEFLSTDSIFSMSMIAR